MKPLLSNRPTLWSRWVRLWVLAKRLAGGGTGPILSFVALFALPLLGAVVLDSSQFAFWSLLATIATVALSLDFGGAALITARFYSEPRGLLLIKASVLSMLGALVVGAIACLIWIPYSSTELGKSIALSDAIAAIMAMSTASAIRSVLMVVAQAALVASKLALRNVATAGHAFCASAITVGLLFSTRSYWALPLGWLISGMALLFVTIPWAKRACVNPATETVVTQPFRWRQFAGLRTLSTITSSAMMNSDRWIVGALGGPALLAAYEVAWRFAALPRFLVINLVLRVGADVASLGRNDGRKLSRLLRGTSVVAAIAGVAASGPVVVAYGIFTHWTGKETNWPMFITMLAVLTFSSLTAPLSFSGAAVGNAWIDIPYAFGALVVGGAAAVLAAHYERPQLFIFGYLLALAISVCCYFLYAPILVRRGLRSREAAVVARESQVSQ